MLMLIFTKINCKSEIKKNVAVRLVPNIHILIIDLLNSESGYMIHQNGNWKHSGTPFRNNCIYLSSTESQLEINKSNQNICYP